MKKIVGLSSEQVEERINSGKINIDTSVGSRSVSQILKSNILTLFNLVNVILACCVVFTGQYKNMLFMVVIVVNVCIGIVQEIRSKKTTDKLKIVTESHVEVIRDDEIKSIAIHEIVLDDVIKLGRGSQIPADSTVISGECFVNESLLTGESDLIQKIEGSELMSGSFINSGTIWAKVVHVGADNYAAKITAAAKENKAVNSEIMKSLNAIIKYVSILLFPVGIILLTKYMVFDGLSYTSAILSCVSALVGMIPEGLILLTSTVLAVAVIRLAKKNVLVQQLYCIETLARVDTLCLDKTGTITTGNMEVNVIECLGGVDPIEVDIALKSIVNADDDKNDTSRAIHVHYQARHDVNIEETSVYAPFMSETKWSGATLLSGKSYVMGASQFVLKGHDTIFNTIKKRQTELAADSRVLLLCSVDSLSKTEATSDVYKICGNPKPLAFVSIRDEIRKSAAQTIKYFTEQGVDLKVISGDDPITVSGIAKKVGIQSAERYCDASKLETDDELEKAINSYSVFGRVKPEQKCAFVEALQKNNHIVAMTGDGVNDVLALKKSDCSVVMSAGADAARNVAHLVLVDNDFAHMPEVVAEGRRSINNLQRSGSLFLVKTIMSLFLGLLFVFLPWQYPFTPIQMTLFSCCCIGIPSFVLALEPNKERVRGHFLSNCIMKSIPGGVLAVITILCMNMIGYEIFNLEYREIATVCLLSLCFLGWLLIVRLSIPYTPIRAVLTAFIVLAVVGGVVLFPQLFDISTLNQSMLTLLIGSYIVNFCVYNLLYNKIISWQVSAIEKESAGQEDRITRFFRKFF